MRELNEPDSENPDLRDQIPRDESRSRAEVLADWIQQQIEERRLSEGEFLGTKAHLQEATGVSASTTNEALKLLQAHGQVFLKQGPGGGVFVANPPLTVRLGQSLIRLSGDSIDIADALEVRRMLDVAMIVEAARVNQSPRDYEQLWDVLRRMSAAVESRDPTRFFLENMEFHLAVASTTGNEVLEVIYKALLGLITNSSIRVLPIEGSEGVERSKERLAVHEAIAKAIADGDVDAARTAAEKHELALDHG